ncbi:aminoglycoside phosphotransferase family protein [Paenibacillus sp. MWE-103]|uniref:Aminoglycoside phosphotransferase family protein n=1 Tax=Paenibacillus artemisiicola TaxID=1172618 RepID=A0ABS3WEJ8_9BACL|nr:aminoglycoside phosphotransferase family protein [Paenibacillus artemisiicola]MBO7746751.1 aminoglycoside phosphotransferase family protein [Paenibacillus artemisiicola]
MKDLLPSEAAQIAGDFLQEEIKSSYQITGKGIDNQIYVLETEYQKVVVRMNIKDTYPTYVKEKWCIEQATAVGVPGPEVLSIGVVNETAYMIQTFIHGDNGLDSKVHKPEIWRRLGEYAKRIDSIPVSGFGRSLLDSVSGVFQSLGHAKSDGSLQGDLQHNIHCLTEHDPLIKLGVITQEESKRVQKLFENMKNETFRFGLIHGDFSLKNIIVHDNQVILLDWGNSEVNVVPHGAVLQVLQYHMLGLKEGPNTEEFQAFLEGYGLSNEALASMRALQLLKAFDHTRWAINRCPERIEAYAGFAKQVVSVIMN